MTGLRESHAPRADAIENARSDEDFIDDPDGDLDDDDLDDDDFDDDDFDDDFDEDFEEESEDEWDADDDRASDALRAMRPGEELTIDDAWPAGAGIPCRCGTPSCRGRIVAEDKLAAVEDADGAEHR